FHVQCTKGTYVRTLAHDLGQRLGCGGHLKALRRVTSGHLNVADALPLEQILTMPLPDLEKRLIPAYEAAPRVALG
ncbi:MAG TPA: tRNA pseudouridine(55) synthase, partial [Opitutaceae bacterium]